MDKNKFIAKIIGIIITLLIILMILLIILNKEKEKNKKESEVKFPKTDTRQSKKKEDICCYTELPKSKKPLSLKEKLFKNRFIGGR